MHVKNGEFLAVEIFRFHVLCVGNCGDEFQFSRQWWAVTVGPRLACKDITLQVLKMKWTIYASHVWAWVHWGPYLIIQPHNSYITHENNKFDPKTMTA